MKKLLKMHDLNSDMQYYEGLIHLYRIGLITGASDMFNDMPLKNKKEFIKAISPNSVWGGMDELIKERAFSHFLTIL